MEDFRRRHLPHYDVARGTYFITTCLAGSIPTVGLASLRRQAEIRSRAPRPAGLTPAAWKRMNGLEAFAASEQWLDRHPAVRWLADGRLAAAVQAELLREAGVRYELHAFVIMPSHVHLLFTPLAVWGDERDAAGRWGGPRTSIMKAFKGRTALACNRILGRSGPFWQSESYDRVVRDEKTFAKIVDYIEHNPVKAGLCTRAEGWEFSSACVKVGQAVGQAVRQASACRDS
jgi:REP element-mobilizing transposase RayT